MTSAPPPEDTRERLLVAASRLFAIRGFEGTSTRQVADAVGIRQPSIFHHFATKAEILKELIHRDLVPARQHLAAWFDEGGAVAPRFAAYLIEDLHWLINSRFDNRGLYVDELLATPEFAAEAALRADFHAGLEAFLAAGVATREFRAIETAFVREVIVALSLDTIRATATGLVGDPGSRPATVTAFLLRSILDDPSSVDRVIDQAQALRTRASLRDG